MRRLLLSLAMTTGCAAGGTVRPGPVPSESAAPLHPQGVALAALRSVDSMLGPAPALCFDDRYKLPAPDAAVLARTRFRHRLRSRARCPETINAMVLLVDSSGRPLGRRVPKEQDPWWFMPARVDTLPDGTWQVEVETMQGTSGPVFQCLVHPSAPDRAECKRTGFVFS